MTSGIVRSIICIRPESGRKERGLSVLATEQGIIIRVYGNKALVKTQKSSQCAGCTSKDSCHGQSGDDVEVEAFNPLGGKVGEVAVIAVATGSFLKATFMMYIFPVICLIAGAFIGEKLGSFYGSDATLSSVIAALAAFGVSAWVVKIKGNQMGRSADYQPKIIRIVR